MHNNTNIYFLINEYKQENKKSSYQKITDDHRHLLNLNLLNNAVEQVSKFDKIKKFILSPEGIHLQQNNNCEIIKYNSGNSAIDKLIERQPDENERYLLIFSNVIGFSQDDVKRINDLLLYDGNALVIGKTKDNRICFIGTNFLDTTLLNHVAFSNNNYDKLLGMIKRDNVYFFVLDNFLKIESLKDFKELYTTLSDKRSENFCTGEIHESFTNLFIEYKELLQ